MRSATLPSAKPGSPRVSVDKYRRNVGEIVRLTREHGAKALMIDLPPSQDHDAYVHVMTEVSHDLSVPMVIYTGPRIDVVHPTRDGHAQLADAVLDQLRSERWIHVPAASD